MGAETWSTTKSQEKRVDVNKMRMLRWMCGVIEKDKSRNEHCERISKISTSDKNDHREKAKRRDDGHMIRTLLDAPVP